MTKGSDDSGCCGLIALGAFIYGICFLVTSFGSESGCETYGSAYSCSYLKEKAQYDVFYWRNLQDDNEDDNKLIASAKGLAACRGKAIEYAARIEETWNDRAYICVLVKDGQYMEKHRLIAE